MASDGNYLKNRIRRVIFVSQRQAETMRVPRLACVISITDPHRAAADLQAGWLGTLRLAFHDVDQITFPGANPDLSPLSKAQAESIAKFIKEHAPAATRLVVHCRHGISRSSAIAKAICEQLEIPFPASYEEFNRQVYMQVAGALRCGTSGGK